MIKNRIVVREKSTNENRTFVLFSCLHLYTFKKMSDIIGTVNTVLSANMNFPTGILRNVTFIRNEEKMTPVCHKNGRSVTNLITNFWLIVIVIKVTNGGIYHE